ncbi:MAG TPA: TolC family protein [Cryomorphaceae bacterium]|nr:TolC family protein [Cryomorphaceae bacterium]
MIARIILLFIPVVFSFQLAAQEAWNLQQCIDYAMESNLTVLQSKLNIERSEVDYDQSRFSLLPNLNAQASYGYNFGQRIDPFTNQFATQRVGTGNAFLSSSVDLFNAFSKMNNIRRNEQNMKASQFDYENVKNDISLQLCLFYLDILLNKENVAIAKEQVKISEAQVARVQQLVDAGQEPRGSLYDAESQLAQEEFNLTRAQNQVVLSRLNLVQLLQLSPEEAENFEVVSPDLSDEGIELIDNSARDIYLRAKQTMPDIKAAEARRLASEYNLASAQGNLYPTLSLSGSIGSGYSENNTVQAGDPTVETFPIGRVEGTNNLVVTDQLIYERRTKNFTSQMEDNFNQNVQLSLNIPIFNGNSARAAMTRAKINQLDADISYSQISNQLRFEIEQAYADAKAAMNSFTSAEKAVRALEESFKYAEVRFEQNVINAVEYNNIKTQFTNAQSDMIRAKYDFVFRTKILDFYLGNAITL